MKIFFASCQNQSEKSKSEENFSQGQTRFFEFKYLLLETQMSHKEDILLQVPLDNYSDDTQVAYEDMHDMRGQHHSVGTLENSHNPDKSKLSQVIVCYRGGGSFHLF